VRGDDGQFRKIPVDGRDFLGQELFFSGGSTSPTCSMTEKPSRKHLEDGPQPPVVQPKALKIGVQLDPDDSRGLKPGHLGLVVRIIRMQGAESRTRG
jgi:hypothetical protein